MKSSDESFRGPGETVLGVYRIMLDRKADADAFEEMMKSKVFPRVGGIGQPTRGGMVMAQSLLRRRFPGPENEYSWLVEWIEAGGSPFGSEGRPSDPAPLLEAFGAKTEFDGFAVVAEQRARDLTDRDMSFVARFRHARSQEDRSYYVAELGSPTMFPQAKARLYFAVTRLEFTRVGPTMRAKILSEAEAQAEMEDLRTAPGWQELTTLFLPPEPLLRSSEHEATDHNQPSP